MELCGNFGADLRDFWVFRRKPQGVTTVEISLGESTRIFADTLLDGSASQARISQTVGRCQAHGFLQAPQGVLFDQLLNVIGDRDRREGGDGALRRSAKSHLAQRV